MTCKRLLLVGMLGLIWQSSGFGQDTIVQFNEAQFRDRVFACWLGKNIGGTLGMPFEGDPAARNISFYTHLKPGEPAANDDLDLQLLWLKALEENNGRVDARILGEYWLKFIPVNWNEYGVGKRNMKLGILPPVSGAFDNERWKHSNGAWIRTEIWACLAPGCPGLAARMAREDACVDHGQAEGTMAAIFVAAIESAAFVESDRDKLIAIGLSMIPEDCQVALAVKAAQEAYRSQKDWKTARADIIKTTESTGWFQAPRNIGYVVLGWLYGEGDFGKSICMAVNCGDDTDCTGATLGSILGIIGGSKGIPARWKDPIGLAIRNCAISGFEAPADINILTDRTVAMARKVMALNKLPVGLTPGPANLSRAGELTLIDTQVARQLWALSPWKVVWMDPSVRVILDYQKEPYITANQPRQVQITMNSVTDTPKTVTVRLEGMPAGWKVSNLPEKAVTLEPEGSSIKINLDFLSAEPDPGYNQMMLLINVDQRRIRVPLTLVCKDTPGPDDLALAANGALARSDGELDREPGCTPRAIDGIIATAEDFSNRWHSSLDTPHPHWIEVKLPEPETVGRMIIRFADPQGYPTRFEAQARLADGTTKTLFSVNNNENSQVYRASFKPVQIDTVRLIIHSSANPAYPNASQISELELYSPKP
ncbi:MAG: ADP-ribosylglycohydrolase family protein [Sedimentisphaerales bacterium]|nr:ADP-ribosylglycohydrolase family protein [Sedimentisphaerales bacterium]